MLSVFVFLWAVIQFYSHWYYTLFGASEEKIISYNQFFQETYHIIPSSKTILIPDFYHIILHIFILATLFNLIIFFITNRKNYERFVNHLNKNYFYRVRAQHYITFKSVERNRFKNTSFFSAIR